MENQFFRNIEVYHGNNDDNKNKFNLPSLNYHQLESELNNDNLKTNIKFKVKVHSVTQTFNIYANDQLLIQLDFYHGARNKDEMLLTRHDNWLTLRQYKLLDHFDKENIKDQLIYNDIFKDARVNYADIALYQYFNRILFNEKINKTKVRKALKMPIKLFNESLSHLLELHYLNNNRSGEYRTNSFPYQDDEEK